MTDPQPLMDAALEAAKSVEDAKQNAEFVADSLAIARFTAASLDSKKIDDVAIFDVRDTLQITDYFVLGSGTNSRQLKAAGDFVDKELRTRGVDRLGVEGYGDNKWVLFDYGIVVVHLFLEEQRRFYDLELLWGDSPRVDWRPSS